MAPVIGPHSAKCRVVEAATREGAAKRGGTARRHRSPPRGRAVFACEARNGRSARGHGANHCPRSCGKGHAAVVHRGVCHCEVAHTSAGAPPRVAIYPHRLHLALGTTNPCTPVAWCALSNGATPSSAGDARAPAPHDARSPTAQTWAKTPRLSSRRTFPCPVRSVECCRELEDTRGASTCRCRLRSFAS